MSAPQSVILAAGMGTRLGRPLPKPLTVLAEGRSILEQQIDNLRSVFGDEVRIMAVVGFKADLLLEAAPDLVFAYNQYYDRTNTSKSLLKALVASHKGGVLWMNGDVVFDPRILAHVQPAIDAGESFICVNTSTVAEEEVKYTVDGDGFVRELSKTVVGGLGEAVGINYVAKADKSALVKQLRACADGDYFERGIETAIAERGLRFRPIDISQFAAIEVDFEDDLTRANELGRFADHPDPAYEPVGPEIE